MNAKKHYPGSDFEDAKFKKLRTWFMVIRIVQLLAIATGLLIIGIKLSR
ncbi:MAG: hypothetical protein PHQ65_15720 [Bacteroidales bacterium]|nr:hypothetical protein [Bacteroidales bacterium]MDD3666714.1 hypothetical protein [Bacteroidales bacterium]